MFTSLAPGAIHIKLPWEQCLPLARQFGFDGIDVEIDLEHSPAYYTDHLSQHGLRVGGMVLPVAFRDDQAKFRATLETFPRIAATARAIGLSRFYIWIMSFSDTLTYQQNIAFHVERLRPAAGILADHGCSLGLEFLGPRSLRIGHRYPFVRTLEHMLELCGKVGDNCGVLLDSWHWYTSLGIVEDIRALDAKQVVYVHVNDAPAGIAVEQQKDSVRTLPGATGVQDITGFIQALRAIHYDGPIVAEPFDVSLKALAPEESARVVAASLKKILG